MPKRVTGKLVEQAKAKGGDRIEFTLNQLEKMRNEDSEEDKKAREEETDYLPEKYQLCSWNAAIVARVEKLVVAEGQTHTAKKASA